MSGVPEKKWAGSSDRQMRIQKKPGGSSGNNGIRMRQEELQALKHEQGLADLETLEFIQAIERYRRKTRTVFPSWSEVLEIFRSLGYRKVKE